MSLPASMLLSGSPYVGYAYGYPHKTAYRPLAAPVDLTDLWRTEKRDALSLYIHVPFCEMRCGFCNLFTQVGAEESFEAAYLAALERQASAVQHSLGSAQFARAAIGGGTPTALEPQQLDRVFRLLRRLAGSPGSVLPLSVETSPETATRDRLALLKSHGVTRLSIGVQSFFDAECKAIGRPQRRDRVEQALTAIRDTGVPVLNIDLMYGLPGQTAGTFLESIDNALRWKPEELYLYPLYVRPMTGLDRMGRSWDDERIRLYRVGRDHLLAQGYAQVSMRMFRSSNAPGNEAPEYTCQTDGMIGLGCGARSYATELHYSDEFAVGARGVREILAGFVARPAESFQKAWYGFALDEDERRRRFVILSLLSEGLDLDVLRERFGPPPAELQALQGAGLATVTGSQLRLTPMGVERSDAIGPFLSSAAVRARMTEFSLR
jgi:oxygen-independent coproporphyrinogen-3 oxidase